MYKIPINKLTRPEKERLFCAMGKTEKGRKQLEQYRSIEKMGLYFIGCDFMMNKDDYDEYLKPVSICQAY